MSLSKKDPDEQTRLLEQTGSSGIRERDGKSLSWDDGDHRLDLDALDASLEEAFSRPLEEVLNEMDASDLESLQRIEDRLLSETGDEHRLDSLSFVQAAAQPPKYLVLVFGLHATDLGQHRVFEVQPPEKARFATWYQVMVSAVQSSSLTTIEACPFCRRTNAYEKAGFKHAGIGSFLMLPYAESSSARRSELTLTVSTGALDSGVGREHPPLSEAAPSRESIEKTSVLKH